MTTDQTTKYIDVLQKILHEYNNRYHTSIKMTSFQATNPENKSIVLNNLYSKIQPLSSKPLETESEYRSIKILLKWTKWTKEIFVVDKVNNTNPITYKIPNKQYLLTGRPTHHPASGFACGGSI